jgi:hypothetical protein
VERLRIQITIFYYILGFWIGKGWKFGPLVI